jgi:SAM-dependent methyltransferase
MRLVPKLGQLADVLLAVRAKQRVSLNRRWVAERYLRGRGIEIGGLHRPLAVPKGAHVRFVDRMSVDDLREQYPELATENLVPVDIVDDGERLTTLADGSEDFVIANHFLEHCEDPILALGNMLRVLRPDGTVYLAVPEQTRTFDSTREPTPFEHLVRDHEQGTETSRRGHFEEWARHVDRADDPAAHADELMRRGYSIHFHVWTARTLLEFLVSLPTVDGVRPFELELFFRNDDENVAVLRRLADR